MTKPVVLEIEPGSTAIETGKVRVLIKETHGVYRYDLDLEVLQTFITLGTRWSEPQDYDCQMSQHATWAWTAKFRAKRMLRRWRKAEARGGLRRFEVYG